MTTLRTISNENRDCFMQMALDEALFVTAQQSQSAQPMLRFYQFDQSSATLGFSQRNRSLLQSVDAKESPWVRRLTGGGLVWHDQDLIFSLVLSESIHPDFHCAPKTYELIHQAVCACFKHFGKVPAIFLQDVNQKKPDELICFEHPVKNDILLGQDKIAGGAERRSGGFLLHQGSLKLCGIDRNEFETQLIRILSSTFHWKSEASDLTAAEIEMAAALKQFKYQTHNWNWKGKTDFQKDHDKKTHTAIFR